jgi:hypothetical protein
MPVRLRNPGTAASAIQTLEQLRRICEDCLSGTDAEKVRFTYLTWVDTAYSQYRSLFVDGLLADGLHSPLYWEITRAGSSPRPWDLVRREVQIQTGRIDEAITTLTGYQTFADREGHLVVPDTSAFTRGEWFEDIDWPTMLGVGPQVRLVVPILVVEELDGLKDRERTSKNGDRARRVVQRLRDLFADVPPGQPAHLPKCTTVTIEILLDSDWHQRRPNHDGEIIDQALLVQDMTGHPVRLACVDAPMEFRARQHGLLVHAIPTPEEVRTHG